MRRKKPKRNFPKKQNPVFNLSPQQIHATFHEPAPTRTLNHVHALIGWGRNRKEDMITKRANKTLEGVSALSAGRYTLRRKTVSFKKETFNETEEDEEQIHRYITGKATEPGLQPRTKRQKYNRLLVTSNQYFLLHTRTFYIL